MSDFVDTHAHIQGSEYDADRDAVIERARVAGVTTLIVPGVDVETSRAALALANRHEGVYAAVGVHPHEASHLDASAMSAFVDLLEDPRCVAVGETGLDFYRMHSTREQQIEALIAMLTFAAKIELPVVIHCRDAWDALAEVLEPWARALAKTFRGGPMGVLHYFSSDLETARRYVDLGFMISV
ncbi:MAG TPA: TatD family hydrolase, partial [Dehalococcoidia bacterium]|nr:TatD family hydrolase [Dehalococcoidia bacterium]